jgi:hypothetical protein
MKEYLKLKDLKLGMLIAFLNNAAIGLVLKRNEKSVFIKELWFNDYNKAFKIWKVCLPNDAPEYGKPWNSLGWVEADYHIFRGMIKHLFKTARPLL